MYNIIMYVQFAMEISVNNVMCNFFQVPISIGLWASNLHIIALYCERV